MDDARTKLLDALAEVERLAGDDEQAQAATLSELSMATLALLPTLSALRKVVEMHGPGRTMAIACDECGKEHPCPTLRTLTRQFEEE